MRTSLCFLVVLFAAIQAAIGADQSRSAAGTAGTIVPADWKPMHERWQAAVEELKIPGVAIVAVKDDDVVLLDAIGVCDPQGKQPVTPRSPFYLASVTKSFTALGVAILIDEGKVKLDEPVKTYLPRFTLANPKRIPSITVRALLSHRYGLDSQPISLAEAYLGNINDERYYHLLGLVVAREKFQYSNLHFTLAGRIIEATSGKSWKDFLAERVFAPLKMHDATCYASKLYANPLAAWPIVEVAGEWKLAPLVKNDAVMHAAGGMGCSASDMANWLRFQLSGKTPDGKQLISPELLREVRTQQAVNEDPSENLAGLVQEGYALGWFTGKFHGRPVLWHGGGYIGTSTIVAFLPEDNVGVAVLMNESAPNGMFPVTVAADVVTRLLGLPEVDLLPRVREIATRVRVRMAERPKLTWEAPTAENGLSRPLEEYVGTYENSTFGELVLGSSDGKLTAQFGTLNPRCHALDEDELRVEIMPGQVVVGRFKIDDDGNVTGLSLRMPAGNGQFEKTK